MGLGGLRQVVVSNLYHGTTSTRISARQHNICLGRLTQEQRFHILSPTAAVLLSLNRGVTFPLLNVLPCPAASLMLVRHRVAGRVGTLKTLVGPALAAAFNLLGRLSEVRPHVWQSLSVILCLRHVSYCHRFHHLSAHPVYWAWQLVKDTHSGFAWRLPTVLYCP
jgi:hypothetical protein